MKLTPIYAAVFGLFSCAASAQSAHQHGVAELFFAASGEELEIEIHSPADNFLGFEHAPVNEQQHKILDDAKKQAAQGMSLFSFAGGECELEEVTQHWGSLDQADSEHKDHDDHDHAAHDEHKGHDDHDHAAHDEHKGHDDHDHAAHDEHKGHDDHDHAAHDEHKDHDEHDHAAHDEHKGHDDHDHAAHDEHKGHDDHDHDHAAHASHEDVRLTYHFHCHHLDELKSFDLELFKLFPRMEKIQVQGASERGQVAFDVTPAQNKVNL
ncbi:hypothetical protein OAG1_40390 [Agarivorans sp. OAG1]|uniref:ZrgA family zinc uptake protein n=1 Tax=Agarivorans sp. OAG1 TaxID=3082387 RepID=UPI002B2DDC91|nr:hypothetical protein OAG1_40390 [Agarivorans sp. OAG1]